MDNTNEQKFLEKYKKRVIKETLKCIYKKYKIHDSNGIEIDINTIEKEVLCPKIIKRCIATVGIKQCSKNAIDNYDYCKAHLHKICLKNDNHMEINLPIEYEYKTTMLNKVENVKKIFIEDSFYFVDEKFIYDLNHNKVGYINNKEYILTPDPFILDFL